VTLSLSQGCISTAELTFITAANVNEDMGKKRMQRSVPWRQIFLSPSVWAALISVVRGSIWNIFLFQNLQF
jgi:hypothetical protein